MFEELKVAFFLLIGVFAALTLLSNVENRIPRFPWDILIDKLGFSLYIPVTTSIVLTILLLILKNIFNLQY